MTEGASRRPLSQRAAVRVVRAYQRQLAGRGPLRRVRCSFEGHESCSHYGLRALEERPTLFAALRSIRRRLRRCREAALYRQPDGTLGWGELYDRSVDAPQRLRKELADAGELPVTRGALWLGVALVATRRGAVTTAREARREAERCGLTPPQDACGVALPRPGRELPLVRDGARLGTWLLRRTAWRVASVILCGVLAALLGWVGGVPPSLVLPFVAALVLLLSTLLIRHAWRRHRRVDEQAWRQRFAGARPLGR